MREPLLLDPYNAFCDVLPVPIYEPNPGNPLSGKTVAVKSVPHAEFAVEGRPSTYGGITILKDYIAEEDGELTKKVKSAGMKLKGTTNSPQAGTSNFTSNPLHGSTINPFDKDCSPGGSSGGAAVAAVTGMVEVALGGDGGGSLRDPAARSGLVGHLSSSGVMEQVGDSAYEFGQPGALARDLNLLAEVYNLLRNEDEVLDFTEYLDGKTLRKMRFAVLGSLSSSAYPGDENYGAVELLANYLEEFDHDRVEIDPNDLPFSGPEPKRAKQAYLRGVSIAAASSVSSIAKMAGREPKPWKGDIEWALWSGSKVGPVGQKMLEEDTKIHIAEQQRFEDYMDRKDIDYLVVPTIANPDLLFAKPEHLLSGIQLGIVSALALTGLAGRIDFMKLVADHVFPNDHGAENIWGTCSTSIPVQMIRSPSGLMVPIGAKIIGRRHSDAESFGLVKQVSEAVGEGGFQAMARQALESNGSEHWLD